jgi:hypothetical protein
MESVLSNMKEDPTHPRICGNYHTEKRAYIQSFQPGLSKACFSYVADGRRSIVFSLNRQNILYASDQQQCMSPVERVSLVYGIKKFLVDQH